MQQEIKRPFWFETPIILDGVNYGNVVYRGIGKTYSDDKDQCFLEYELETVVYMCSSATYTSWLVSIDLPHMVKEHLKWVFQDLTTKAA